MLNLIIDTYYSGIKCRKNEKYYECVPHCRHTCFNYDNYKVPCPDICLPGCFCNPGLVVNEEGNCVDKSECKDCELCSTVLIFLTVLKLHYF